MNDTNGELNGRPVSPVSDTIRVYPVSEIRRNRIIQDGNSRNVPNDPDPYNEENALGPNFSHGHLEEHQIHPLSDEKKSGFLTIIRNLSIPASLAGELSNTFSPDRKPTWNPTFLQPLPLAGVAALLGCLCCLLASLGILIGSHGQPAADWPWPPSVFLAIFSAIINRVTQFSLFQAIPIAWWYSAYRGATIARLQGSWEISQGVFRAFLNARHDKVLAIAMIATTLVAIDGPFLQKASSTVSETQTKPTKLMFPVAEQLPRGFSGTYSQYGELGSDEMNPVLDGYTVNSTITANVTGCQGRCETKVRAPGAVIKNCSSQTWPLDEETLKRNKSATWGPGVASAHRTARMPLFNTHIRPSALRPPFESGPEEVELIVGIANFTKCVGQYVETTCTLVAATLEYDIVVHEDNVLTFAQPPAQARVVALANNTFLDHPVETVNGDPHAKIALAITSLAMFLDGQIASNATNIPVSDGQEAESASRPDAESFNNFVTRYTILSNLCETSFRDPTLDIMSEFNNLMFRSGIVVSQFPNETRFFDPGMNTTQEVNATQTRTLNVFKSDLKWFAGAALFELLAILAIAPVFWGWWKLGVRVSMSPFEIANVFGAPLLRDVNSAGGSRGVVRRMGDVKVQFGAENEYMGSDGNANPITTARLVVNEEGHVVRPRKGTKFE